MARCGFCGGEDVLSSLFSFDGSTFYLCSICRHLVNGDNYEVCVNKAYLNLGEAAIECPICKRSILITNSGQGYVCVCDECKIVLFNSIIKPEVEDV